MPVMRIAFAAALLTASGSAVAQTATDAGCIVVSNVFASDAKEPTAQKAAQASLYFYLGRISDRTSAAQLKALLDQQVKGMTAANAGEKMNACVKGLQAKIDLMQSLAPPAAAGAQPAQPTQPQPKPQGR